MVSQIKKYSKYWACGYKQMRWTNSVGGPPISIITLSDQLTDKFFNASEDGKMDQLVTEVQNLMTLV